MEEDKEPPPEDAVLVELADPKFLPAQGKVSRTQTRVPINDGPVLYGTEDNAKNGPRTSAEQQAGLILSCSCLT